MQMPTTEDEPEVRNRILFGILALCAVKEAVSLISVIG